MKKITLLVVSMIFLSACDSKMPLFGPKENYNPPNPPSPKVVDTVYYKTKVVVKMESGDPCKNAMLHLVGAWNPNFYPDSTDTIHVTFPQERFSGPQFSTYPHYVHYECIIYMDQDDEFIYQGVRMLMNRTDIPDLYIPVYNVIFAESPRTPL